MTTTAAAAPSHRDGEAGGILALTLGALGVVALLVVVIAVASAIYLDRRELLALADVTAAHAAAQVDREAYGDGEIAVTDRSVRAAAQEFLAAAPHQVIDIPGLALAEPTGAVGPTAAEVTLEAVSRPGFLPWVLIPWSDGVALRVTARAGSG